eukprot:s2067_g12.t1
MDERAAPITGNYARLLTILSKDVLTVSQFGMVISDAVHTEGDGQERSSGSRPSSSAIPVTGDASATQSTPVAQPQQQQDDVQMSSPPVPQTIAVQPDNAVKIAGVDVYSNSSISVLKAACSFLQVSQSGSKQKLWRRILSTLDKQAILAETELAAVALDEAQRTADSVQVANPPEDPAEIEAHNLTHLPYQPWCPACVMAKGAVHCIPVQNKSQTKYMSQEIMRFITFLGYSTVMLRCDQEPATLQIQKLVQRARQRLNMRTLVEDAKVALQQRIRFQVSMMKQLKSQGTMRCHLFQFQIWFQLLKVDVECHLHNLQQLVHLQQHLQLLSLKKLKLLRMLQLEIMRVPSRRGYQHLACKSLDQSLQEWSLQMKLKWHLKLVR